MTLIRSDSSFCPQSDGKFLFYLWNVLLNFHKMANENGAQKKNIFYWNAYNIILASEFKAQTLITCIKRLEISPHRLPVFPLTLSQLPAARSNLSPESASAAAARSGGQNTKRVSVTNQISSIRIVFSWYASCSQRIYLIDGSLLLGGPSLLAVMQLLQIAL